MLVADRLNHRIRLVDLNTGEVSTLAGSGTPGDTDQTGTNAAFDQPSDVAVSSDGSFAVVADLGNHLVRKVSLPGGVVTVLAGTSGVPGTDDGTGLAASFNSPCGVALSSTGTFVLVGDSGTGRVRRIDVSSGAVTTLSTTASGACGVAISSDDLFAVVAGSSSNRVYKILLTDNTLTTLAGDGTVAVFQGPTSVSLSPDDAFVVVADKQNDRLRLIKVDTGVVSTLGGGTYNKPSGVSFGPGGTIIVVADLNAHKTQQVLIPSSETPCQVYHSPSPHFRPRPLFCAQTITWFSRKEKQTIRTLTLLHSATTTQPERGVLHGHGSRVLCLRLPLGLQRNWL